MTCKSPKLPTIKDLPEWLREFVEPVSIEKIPSEDTDVFCEGFNQGLFLTWKLVKKQLLAHEQHAKEMLDMWTSKRAEAGKYEKFRQKEIGFWQGALWQLRALKSHSPSGQPAEKSTTSKGCPQGASPQVLKSKGETK